MKNEKKELTLAGVLMNAAAAKRDFDVLKKFVEGSLADLYKGNELVEEAQASRRPGM